MRIEIPLRESLDIKHLVFDYNGTIAKDGHVLEEFVRRVLGMKDLLIHVITADTHGTVRAELKGTGIQIEIISKENGTEDKKNFVDALGRSQVIAFGNGFNDRLMLAEAGIGVCIIGDEGASVKALMSADLVVNSLDEALGLIENPKRIIAGLRA